ncbi:MAG: 3,4-dihydroxy-2-butanone-4-phosphate synthase [Candidatus Micrarchaeota archaeon]
MLTSSLASFRQGKFAVLYDSSDREGEADLVLHASFASSKAIQTLRKDAGGLICFATSSEMLKKTGLDYTTNMLQSSNVSTVKEMVSTKTPYGDSPAFSIWVNHKKTFTGITDIDRAKTFSELAKLVSSKDAKRALIENFYTPGHVPLLFARDIKKRKGHTELVVALSQLAKMPAAVIICEMLGNGSALSFVDAKKYAKKNKIPFIEGKQIFNQLINNKSGESNGL